MLGARLENISISFGHKLALALILLSVSFGFSQSGENTYNQKVIGKLASYAMKHSPEKVYVHTDKSIYTNGETIWYKVYLVDGILHKESEKSKIIYVELWDGSNSLIIRQRLISNGLGAQGSIKIPINVKTGEFLIRAYTKYMLNEREPALFQKEIPVYAQEFGDYTNSDLANGNRLENHDPRSPDRLSKHQKPVLQFFPEGGHLVAGLPNVLGIKAVDKEGNGLELEGTIQDKEGNTVGFFKSYEAGLGKVAFTPKEDTSYDAVVSYLDDEYRFPLPEAQPKGYVLSIRNNEDHLVVNIATNKDEGLDGTLLIGHFRGDLFFERTGKLEDGATYSVKLNTDRLFDGVAHFTLFTAVGEPVCERLVFIDHPQNEVELEVSSDAREYGPREMVTLDLRAQDAKGTELKGDFSISVVTESNQLPEYMVDTNIKSWLLLNSDLGNSVDDASYFFENDSRERKYLLDALMLTHGWRRFVWKTFLDPVNENTKAFVPEKLTGTVLSGFTALAENPKIRKNARVSLRIPELDVMEEQATDHQGRFSFGPYDLDDGTRTYLEIVGRETRSKRNKEDILIYMDEEWSLPEVNRVKKVPVEPKEKNADKGSARDSWDNTERVRDYLLKAYRKKGTDFTYDPTITQLEEVEVSADAKKKTVIEEIASSTLHGSATIRLFADSKATVGLSAIDLIGQAPGVLIMGVKPNQTVRIRGLSGIGTQGSSPSNDDALSSLVSPPSPTTPLIIVDGNEVNLDYLQHMDASEILYVDVLRGIEASIYGLRGYPGVIVIATRSRLFKGSVQKNVPESSETLIPGFYKEREFFSPDYSFKRPDHEKLDYRTTLFWKPDIAIEHNRQQPIRFYTGDTTGDFIIKVEGITRDGRAATGQYTFEVHD